MAQTKNNEELMQALAQRAENLKPEPKKNPQTLKDWTLSMLPQIEKALPKVITPDRFTRIVLTALSSNPKLASCDRNSFLGAIMQAAQLGLEPNTPLGQAYLIPFKNTRQGILECQFQIGYKGLLDLAYRSGEVQTVQAHGVYENDEFEYELGLEGKMKHKPTLKDRGELIAVYAIFKTVKGGYGFEVMSVEDIRAHAKKYSKSYNAGPWQTNFEEMAKKTVLKRALKYAPLKTEFLQALAADEAILKTDETNPDHIDVEYTIFEDSDEEKRSFDQKTEDAFVLE